MGLSNKKYRSPCRKSYYFPEEIMDVVEIPMRRDKEE